ncbi:MAG: 2-oxoglutarate dehydrogenase [Bacteroidetes bacterium GWF2_38_335]|nr:MAG: 2-oxoglutarate dehydrogenase [Bacteroidetes bacterium GWF2_38_335]OFY77688.1 MAG: 2-oxoglutarate dehydrogenase [Bacteroidetes bacterium RIFOXYA12_FULL_38_20]HBS89081.1 dihydrolipoyllysine-residue succinyltransferase [Bacteroidales bacterium]
MIIEIKIPSPGESISEVLITRWFVKTGDVVYRGQELAEIESDKATLTLVADEGGKIELFFEEGQTVKVGAVACRIDTSFKTDEKTAQTEISVPGNKIASNTNDYSALKATPLAKKMMEKANIEAGAIKSDHKITSRDVMAAMENKPVVKEKRDENAVRTKMTPLRKKLSERLVAVKNQTAMLTTFNEVDMSNVMAVRKKMQADFQAKHGIKLGLMSFFTKAATIALKEVPSVNAMIEGEDILYFNYSDIGIAVQTEKGLMVPVLRDTEKMSLADIEIKIAELAKKAREKKISIDELTGGTFTISNGGVFGSMLSTPILNPPQSGILGMHNIVDRPVAVNGKVEIRPIMYLALSYDHRIIDGRDSVGFLKKIKELIEEPERLV